MSVGLNNKVHCLLYSLKIHCLVSYNKLLPTLWENVSMFSCVNSARVYLHIMQDKLEHIFLKPDYRVVQGSNCYPLARGPAQSQRDKSIISWSSKSATEKSKKIYLYYNITTKFTDLFHLCVRQCKFKRQKLNIFDSESFLSYFQMSLHIKNTHILFWNFLIRINSNKKYTYSSPLPNTPPPHHTTTYTQNADLY